MLKETGAGPTSLDHLAPEVVVGMLDEYESALDSRQDGDGATETPPKISAALAAESRDMPAKPLSQARLLSEATKAYQATGLGYDAAFDAATRDLAASGSKRPPVVTLSERTKAIQLRDRCDYDTAFTCALRETRGITA